MLLSDFMEQHFTNSVCIGFLFSLMTDKMRGIQATHTVQTYVRRPTVWCMYITNEDCEQAASRDDNVCVTYGWWCTVGVCAVQA